MSKSKDKVVANALAHVAKNASSPNSQAREQVMSVAKASFVKVSQDLQEEIAFYRNTTKPTNEWAKAHLAPAEIKYFLETVNKIDEAFKGLERAVSTAIKAAR